MSPRSDGRRRAAALAAICVLAAGVGASESEPDAPPAPIDELLETYFRTFPSRATAEGRHDLDAELEDLPPERLAAWAATVRRTGDEARRLLAGDGLDPEARLDLELVERFAERQRLELEVERRPARDPLFWTGILSNATVFLLVREDRPAAERLRSAAARAARIPRLASQAERALAATDPSEMPAEHVRMAAGQVAAAARFYRGGFARAAAEQAPGQAGELEPLLAESGAAAAAALEALAGFLEELAGRAGGDFRLGDHYPRRFAVVTGVDEPVDAVLAEAERALAAKLREAAAFGRGAWREMLPGEPVPVGDREVLERLFARIGRDRAASVEEFVEDYRALVAEAIEFTRRREVVALPEPFAVWVGRSPGFLLGQSVGGVYPPGPYDPRGPTLLFLPTPPDGISDGERQAFFRDFNHPFNVMITPHEIVPGHALQLVWAARHPRKVRSLFADGVYVEGWGTFCERLMLDLGWGGPAARLAHLKKQLENIARTAVDIRVHTRGMQRDEVLAFVRDEALQDEQFAANMWRRAMTSSPQLTYYHLGYRQVRDLYDSVRRARGESFVLREFMDGMMELGPVPVARYRERMLGPGAAGRR